MPPKSAPQPHHERDVHSHPWRVLGRQANLVVFVVQYEIVNVHCSNEQIVWRKRKEARWIPPPSPALFPQLKLSTSQVCSVGAVFGCKPLFCHNDGRNYDLAHANCVDDLEALIGLRLRIHDSAH